MTKVAQLETLVGRREELRQLRAAIRRREGLLIWGPPDSGKTALVQQAICELAETDRRKCIYWSGAASRRDLLSHFVGRQYELGDAFVQRKVHADGASETSLRRWLDKQRSLRLRGIFIGASTQGEYRVFLDHFPAPAHGTARLLKEIMYRCKTPIYLAARGYSQVEAGYAWTLYWHDALRLRVGPLHTRDARELLEICIRDFGLESLELEDFREDVLRLSGHLPGSIVKMCKLAADSRYHYGDRIKMNLLQVDYLMQANPSAARRAQSFLQ